MDPLPRSAFLGSVLSAGQGADAARAVAIAEAEQMTLSVLPGDVRATLANGSASRLVPAGVPARTVSRVVRRRGLPLLRDLDPLTGVVIRSGETTAVRCEREPPGELVHVDGGGWRVVDDHSRLAYARGPDRRQGTHLRGISWPAPRHTSPTRHHPHRAPRDRKHQADRGATASRHTESGSWVFSHAWFSSRRRQVGTSPHYERRKGCFA